MQQNKKKRQKKKAKEHNTCLQIHVWIHFTKIAYMCLDKSNQSLFTDENLFIVGAMQSKKF